MADRAALVGKVEALLPHSDVSVWDYIDLALEEAALVKATPLKFTGSMEEQAMFLKGWMEATAAKRTAIRALKNTP